MEEEVSTKELLPSKVKSIEGHSNKVWLFKSSNVVDLFLQMESF